jgi:hypothetical protein
MDENDCQVLCIHSRQDLEINLDYCKFTSAGTSALVEVLGRNQGPTRLDCCYIDYSVLANGLSGNSRLKSLTVAGCYRDIEVGNRVVLAIADALKENEGLVDLDLSCCLFSDETWDAICDSLKTHPTLEVLKLWSLFGRGNVAPAVLTSRIRALGGMVKRNTSIQALRLSAPHVEHELFRKSVIPYLETNRLRPRLLAIQKARPTAYRAKVLGRALLSIRTDPNRFWMLLSRNADVVAFSLTTATTTPTARFYRRFCKCTLAARFYRRVGKYCYSSH